MITTDARNKIPQDKAGIGFPWRNPIATSLHDAIPKESETHGKVANHVSQGQCHAKAKGWQQKGHSSMSRCSKDFESLSCGTI